LAPTKQRNPWYHLYWAKSTNCKIQLRLLSHPVYLSLGGPPRVNAATFGVTPDLLVDAPPVPPPSFGGAFDFPGRGSLTPNARSNFDIIAGLGTAFPDSYSPTIWGFSLIAVARSFCVSFFAVRAYILVDKRSKCEQYLTHSRNGQNHDW
jgi:hypothetical protein